MSIVQAELKFYKAEDMSDAGSGGGRMSTTVISDNVKNSVWPDITQAERTAGDNKYRKMFMKVDNAANLGLQTSKIFVENFTPADDSIVAFPGTQTDTISSLTGSERKYGCGQLETNLSPSDTTVSVTTEGVSLDYLQNGDTIRISNKSDVDDIGDEEYTTITSVPSYVNNVATFTVSPAIVATYSAVDTRVASVIDNFTEIVGGYNSLVVTSAGSYDDTTYPILAPNISSIDQTWTLTFTNATTFTITGNTVGLLGSGGNIGSDTSPNNPDYSNPYFTIYSAGFSGTFSGGDTIVFNTTPAAAPIWLNRNIPALSASFTSNAVVIAVDGSSA